VVPARGARVFVIVCAATTDWDEGITQDAVRWEVESKAAESF
jgi:dTDP-4-dehydrorhamnose reductase